MISRKSAMPFAPAIALLALLGQVLPSFGLDLNVRNFTITNDTAVTRPAVRDLKWYQGESVSFDLFAQRDGSPLNLGDQALVARWEVFRLPDTSNAYIMKTGVVVNAAGGHVSFDLAPNEANFSTNTANVPYTSHVRLYQSTNFVGSLDRRDVWVLWGPDSGNTIYRGPYTNITSEIDPVYLAARPGIDADRIAGDLALTNYVDAATNAIAVAGTPNLAAVLTQGNNAETQKIDNLLDVHFVPTNSTVSSTAGNVFFDEADDALSYRTSISDAIMQIGQEQWLRAKQSASAPTITNGVVVYIDGASGNRPTVDLADADLAAADEPVGFATHTFTANDGFVTIHGLVRDVDTSPYAAGDQLYLSSIPGGVTNVEPASGTVYHLGTVARSHATAGIIYANVERHWDNDIDAGDLAVSNWVVSANYLTVESDPLSLYTNGSVPMAASLNMGGQSITNLMDPTAAQDAATKAYVDTAATEADTLATVSARGNTYTGSLSVATSGADGLAIGTVAAASGANSLAAGAIALASAPNSIAAGLSASAAGTNSVAIGNGASASATHLNSVVLSAAAGGASSSGSGQLVLAADSLVRLVGADMQANSNAILKADLSSYAGDNVTWDAVDMQFDASAAGGVSLPINFGVSKSVYSNILTTSHYVGPYFSNSFEWLEIYTNGVLSHYRKTATGE